MKDRLPTPCVADLGERALIERISSRLPAPAPWLTVGIGDDAAVVEPVPNELEVLTTDALIEGIHFDRAFVPADAIGHRALAANLSDLAAMGATPRLVLLSLALPATLLVTEFDALVEGLLALAARFRVALVGGNVARSPGPLVVDITAAGSSRRRRTLTRRGAHPGDEVYVSGVLGAAAAGLQSLRRATACARADQDRQDESGERPLEGEARYLRPEPRVRLGTMLGRNRAATACVDLSDGLGDGVRQIAAASGVGIAIDASALPIDAGARRWFGRQEIDPIVAAIAGGDDYELLFTVSPRLRGRFAAARRLAGELPLTRIGLVTADGALVLRRDGRDEELPPGFAHFR